MAATTQFNQYTGSAAGTKNAGATTCYFMAADTTSSTANRDANPVTVPSSGNAYSYELWYKLEATGGTFTSISDIRHYNSAAPGTGLSIETSANTGTPSNPTGTTPVVTDSTFATTAMPTSDPGAATISGTLTSATDESGYVVTQITVASTATAGFSATQTWKWAEVV